MVNFYENTIGNNVQIGELMRLLWKQFNNLGNASPILSSEAETLQLQNIFNISNLNNKNIPKQIKTTNDPIQITIDGNTYSSALLNIKDGFYTFTATAPEYRPYISIDKLIKFCSDTSVPYGQQINLNFLGNDYKHLEFVYRQQLHQIIHSKNFSWWATDPPNLNLSDFNVTNNAKSLLYNTIPRNFDSNSNTNTYTFILEKYTGTISQFNAGNSHWSSQSYFAANPYYTIDTNTGYLIFLGGDVTGGPPSTNIQLDDFCSQDEWSSNDGIKSPPFFSYIRYVGPTGFDDVEMSGNIVVDGSLNINGDLNINGQNVVNFVKNKYAIGSSTLKTDSVLHVGTSNQIDLSGMHNDISQNIDWNDSSNCFIITQDDHYQINFSVGISSEENFVGFVKANVLVNDISQITVQLGERYVPIEFANIETLTGSKVLSLTTNQKVKLTIQCDSSFNILSNLTYLTINSLDNANITPIFVNEATEKINTNQQTSNTLSLISDSSFDQWISYRSLDISFTPKQSSNDIIYYANLKYILSNIIQNTTNFQETTISIKVDKYIGSSPADSSENLFVDLSLGITGITTINNVNPYEIYHLDKADTTELITYKLSFKINGTDIDAHDDLSFGIPNNTFNYVSYQEINLKKIIFKQDLSDFNLISGITNFFTNPIPEFTLKIVPEDNNSYIFIYINLTYSLFILNNKTINFKLIKYKDIEPPETIFSKRIGTINGNYIKDKFSILHIDTNTHNINNDTLYYTLCYEVDDGGTYSDIQISSENSNMFGYEIFKTDDLINSTLNQADISHVYATTSLQYEDICSTKITIEHDTSYVILNYDVIYNVNFDYNDVISFRLQKTVTSNTINLIEDISLGNTSTSLGFYNNYNINYIDNSFSLGDDISYTLAFCISSNNLSDISLGIILCNQNIYQLKDSNQRVLDSIKYNKAFDIKGSENIKVTTDNNNYIVELKDDINVDTINTTGTITAGGLISASTGINTTGTITATGLISANGGINAGTSTISGGLISASTGINSGAATFTGTVNLSSNLRLNYVTPLINIDASIKSITFFHDTTENSRDGVGSPYNYSWDDSNIYNRNLGLILDTTYYEKHLTIGGGGLPTIKMMSGNYRGFGVNNYHHYIFGLKADSELDLADGVSPISEANSYIILYSYGTNHIFRTSLTFSQITDSFVKKTDTNTDITVANINFGTHGAKIMPHSTDILRFYSAGYFDFYTHNSANILARLDYNGHFYLYGTLYQNESTTIGSDDRIKHNEVNIENGLSVIRQLQPQKYQKTTKMYPADYVGEISGDWMWECGVIAQEILKIDDISFSVSGGDEIGPSGETIQKIYYLNYNNLFTYGLAAIKELDQIVATQATTIANLEKTVQSQSALISDLTSRIEALESPS